MASLKPFIIAWLIVAVLSMAAVLFAQPQGTPWMAPTTGPYMRAAQALARKWVVQNTVVNPETLQVYVRIQFNDGGVNKTSYLPIGRLSAEEIK